MNEPRFMIKESLRYIMNNTSFDTKQSVIRKINNCDYVAFDVFDTLIRRDVTDPKIVFRVMEKKTQILDFAKKRIAAETIARRKYGEVTLFDIYSEFKGIVRSERKGLIDLEMETEKTLCCVNYRVLSFYRYVIRRKPIVLISDMYLSSSALKEMLDDCGISGYSFLFVSNECKASKSEGTLYDYVSEKLKTKKILHIGNDFKNDYLKARGKGYQTAKIRTDSLLRSINLKRKTDELDVFLTNHSFGMNYAERTGYSCLGPVLYGFTDWLHENIRAQGIDRVFFFSRDGYILKKAYEKVFPEVDERLLYFEASRRSLRVPQYRKQQSIEDSIKASPLLPDTNIAQIMDCFGLEIDDYRRFLEKYGYTEETRFKKKELADNKVFREFYNDLQPYILSNAGKEYRHLVSYVRQFDFSGNCAVVDVGWGGSMQQGLCSLLKELNMDCNLYGFYLGLSEKSKLFLEKDGLKAKGYLFDCYNNSADRDLVLSFRSLFESMFLEHKGSVKCYKQSTNKIDVVRYPYEFETKGGRFSESAKIIKEIQKGALRFLKDFKKSPLTVYLDNDPQLFFRNLYEKGTRPSIKDVEMMGDVEFDYVGAKKYLAKPEHVERYLCNPTCMIEDLKDSPWKIGFLKRLMKINLPYKIIYDFYYNKQNV